jgi:F420-non-reducing hydrogenase small subunit
MFELVFCPCLLDVKTESLRAFADGSVDLCLLNGAIRSSENREMAALLRRKSRFLVAFGSCAHEGCIPGLANLFPVQKLLETVYGSPACAKPLPVTRVPEGELTLPVLTDRVQPLGAVEKVDWVIPGCPPEPHQIWPALALLGAALQGDGAFPVAGTTLGAGAASACEECPLERVEPDNVRFHRPHEKVPRPGVCLLDQGFVCSGPATRGGCGALCPRVGMGCRGCYGPPEGVADQGARMIGVLASVLKAGSPEQSDQALRSDLQRASASLVDPVGTLYRHSLAHSLLTPRLGSPGGS